MGKVADALKFVAALVRSVQYQTPVREATDVDTDQQIATC